MFEPSAPHRLWAQAPAWGQWALIVAAGGLAGLGQAPVDQPALTLVGLAFGFWIIRPETSLPYFLRGWSLGFGYFVVSLAWIVEPFLVEGRGTAWMAPFALLAMAGGLALFWGVLLLWRAGVWGFGSVLRYCPLNLRAPTYSPGFLGPCWAMCGLTRPPIKWLL